MQIKQLDKTELRKALPLVWEVFNEYEAVNYQESGKQVFYDAIHSEEYLNTLTAYGAFDNDRLVGIIAARDEGSHVALFFVDGEYHGQGIGRALWNELLAGSVAEIITVHSSVFALDVYKKLGFVQTAELQDDNGIQYIPMRYNHLLDLMQAKDDKAAYAKLKEVIEISPMINKYYDLIEDFAGLLGSDKTYIRTRAFLIICAQARWDEEERIKQMLPDMLKLFHDEKAIVVRQCLNAARDLIEYRPELRTPIAESVRSIDLSNYKESMSSLIQRDIDKLLRTYDLNISIIP